MPEVKFVGDRVCNICHQVLEDGAPAHQLETCVERLYKGLSELSLALRELRGQGREALNDLAAQIKDTRSDIREGRLHRTWWSK